jgi:hypothetical protein
MSKTEIAKIAIKTTVGLGVGKIVGTIVRNNVPPASLSLPQRLCVLAATIVITELVLKKTDAFIDEKVDAIAEIFADVEDD